MTERCGNCGGCQEWDRRVRAVGYMLTTLDDEAQALAEETSLPRAAVGCLLVAAQRAARRADMSADEFIDLIGAMLTNATRDAKPSACSQPSAVPPGTARGRDGR